tara:strand:+ start:190 stop:2670 length:2481 start_codon:yes stop_codon:yes gene_type:complete
LDSGAEEPEIIKIIWEKKTPSWPNEYASTGHHWSKLKEFLSKELKRSDEEIASLDGSSEETLLNLGYPESTSSFDIRGLVIGYVQSGKTQHFSVLAAKAFDAGYDMIIVLSGMENALRNQTQKRLMRDLGYPDWHGVGESESEEHQILWLTQQDEQKAGDGDFRNPVEFQKGRKHLAVLKKNKTPLKNMLKYLTESDPLSLLVIDDEADQASINTNEEKEDATAINEQIRLLLNQKTGSSYVGYTATPFANILTDPDYWSEPAGASLFPKDFIDVLPEPAGLKEGGKYTGNSTFFGNSSDESFKVFEEVSEEEVLSINSELYELDDSALKQAICDYFISCGALLDRKKEQGDPDPPRMMLIHTSHRKGEHENIREQVQKLCRRIKRLWTTPDEAFVLSMKERWENSFQSSFNELNKWVKNQRKFQRFEDIEPHILEELHTFDQDIDIKVLNSNPDSDQLDFDQSPSLRAIAIGGNKLSRGFTIEGLLTSYYVRNTQAGDTLLQMGRWFGYRGDYLDLVRVFTSQDLFSDFEKLNKIETELREEIKILNISGKKPVEMPPALSTHPGIQFTASNKMRAAIDVNLSWSAKDVVTLRLPFDEVEALNENLITTRNFVSSLGEIHQSQGRSIGGLPYWLTDEVEKIFTFLQNFQAPGVNFEKIIAYIRRQNDHEELTKWHVCIAGLSQAVTEFQDTDLSIHSGLLVHPLKRTRRKNDPESLGGLWDPQHYSLGMTLEKKKEAEKYHELHKPLISSHGAYRTFRSPQEGLLVVYPISKHSLPSNEKTQHPIYSSAEDRKLGPDVIGLALSFPRSESSASRSAKTVASEGTK